MDYINSYKSVDSDTILVKLFGSMYSAYLLDVENDMVTTIKPGPEVASRVGIETFSWSSEVDAVIENLVDPYYRENLRNFLKLEHIAVAFKESQAPKEMLFKKSDGAWRRAFIAPVQIDSGFTNSAILLINSDFSKDIVVDEKAEAKAKSLLVQQEVSRDKLGKILKFIYEDYGSMYEIDVLKDEYSTIFVHPKMPRSPLPERGCYSKTNEQGLRGACKEEFEDRRREISSLDNLIEALSNRNRVEYDFETTIPEFPKMRVVYQAIELDESGKPTKIIMAYQMYHI